MDALLSNSLITTTFRRQRLLNDTINAEAGEAAGPEQKSSFRSSSLYWLKHKTKEERKRSPVQQ